MIPALLILIPLLTGLACLLAKASARTVRSLAMTGALVTLALTVLLWLVQMNWLAVDALTAQWLCELDLPWIPALGISLHLLPNGLSVLMVLLTALLGVLSVAVSWRSLTQRVGFFHFNLLLILAGIMGVFQAMDLFAFYFFWEVMLVPMYFLIDLWGHANRHYAAVKFFIFTQVSGLLMLLAILGLYFLHGRSSGAYTFEVSRLMDTPLTWAAGMWLLLGFFAAFAVKLPAVPLHTWLADAHTEAPTAGSVILAGLMLKTGAYGMLQFLWPLFPEAALNFAPVARVLGVVGILYGAILAFAQFDLKRLVAYTSVSHMGFVLLGIFTPNELAWQGAVMQMICHGLGTGGLFILVGYLSDRLHTRDMRAMGGLWASCPRLGGAGMFLAMAALGLPGMGSFVGEILVLMGVFHVSPVLAIVASAGFVLSTVYALWMIQQVFHGREKVWAPDLRRTELGVLAVLIVLLVYLGVYPKNVFDTFNGTMKQYQAVIQAYGSADGQEGEHDRP